MSIKRLIFDVDGTLIRGVNFEESVRQTLIRVGAYSEENVKKFINAIGPYNDQYDNYNVKDYTAHMGDAIGKPLPDNFVSIFFDELKTCIPPYSQSLINQITELARKYELTILTNYFTLSQRNRLNNMGIGQFFLEYYGERKIKPYKEAFIEACGPYKPSQCVMIGDDYSLDILGAREAGLNTIFVNSKGVNVTKQMGTVVNSVEEITDSIIQKSAENDLEI